jgi:hypothetical protein
MPGSFRVYSNSDRECILRNVKPVGGAIGKYDGAPLYDFAEDEWGRIYRYVGICSRSLPHNSSKKYAAILGDREFIHPPGIIYRML